MNVADLFSLTGKTALVTGAGGGIGEAIAHLLAAAGARVICVGRTAAKIERTAAAIRERGGVAEAAAFDVSSEAEVEAAFRRIAEQGQALHVLVNNAAQMRKHNFLTMTGETWDAAQATNTRGAFLCTREAIKLMRTCGGGAIVNIGSVASLHAAVYGNAQYGASKAALLALTRSVAVEFASNGIRCNAVLPGAVVTEGGRAAGTGYPTQGPFAQTQRILLGRIGEPDDIAPAVLYLASDASRYITGQTLIVDGGLMAG